MEQTQGVILSTLNYQDYDLILTVFSSEKGLIKFFFKRGNSKKRRQGTSTDPLTCAEFIYSKGKGELLLCHEISTINAHLDIRKDLKFLETGCSLVREIQQTQFPEKPSQQLYQLLLRYLGHIPKMEHPENLEFSFKLKIMRHDGIFGITPFCTTCKAPLKEHVIYDRESFCPSHAPTGSLLFDEEEANLLLVLAYCRSFSEIPDSALDPVFREKIDRLQR
jgi:DNA repair protein RecO (recombination protein O)